MARTRAEWEGMIDSQLPSLSTSAVAVWKWLRDTVVSFVMMFEAILEAARADMDKELEQKQAWSLQRYVQIAKEFQNGDSLEVDNGVLKYPSINMANRIIAQATVTEIADDILSFKVAKLVSGALAPLSPAELDNFNNYLKARKFPGTKIAVASNSADVVKYTISAFFNPAYNLMSVLDQFYFALDSFRNSFRFDGIFYHSDLVTALKAVPGIVDVTISLDFILSDGTTVNNMTSYLELPAGYFNWHPSSALTSINPAP